MKANELRIGDVIRTSIGPTVVLQVRQTHGGIECRVPRTKARADSPFLWFWPHDPVTVLGRDLARVERWQAAQAARLSALHRRRGTPSSPGSRAPSSVALH